MSREEVLKSATTWFKGDDLRANVWVDKYCLRDGDEYLEKDPDDMFVRLATEFARIEMNYPKPMSYEEIYYLLSNFTYIIPGGSMLYGIGNVHSYSSLGNCFVIGNTEDSYGSIMQIDEEQAQLMKRRGGVGHDLSHLRPKGSLVSNSANTSTGAAAFMHRYSNTTREVGQDGRRGALMLTMNVDHPDILDFVTAKDDLTKVTGANISVKVTDVFMEGVKADNKIAKNIWNTIIHQAWKSAEPGVLFWDTIIKNSPADIYPEFKSISTNPCGEIPLCAYDTCRLMSINLFSFVEKPFTSDAYFDVSKFIIVTKAAMRLMDDAVDLECEKIDKILDKIYKEGGQDSVEWNLWIKIKDKLIQGRRTGLSCIGLADCLAALGIVYGSEKSISFCNLKFKLFHDCAYESSNEMAEQRGAFPLFDKYRGQHLLDDNGQIVVDVPRRNIALLTVPPSGTISMMAGISSGIEPIFNLSYTRRRKVETSNNVAYVDKNGDKWEEYEVFHPAYEQFCDLVNYNISEIERSAFMGATANEIDPFKRVDLQATIQRWIDHSISSTINLPKETTEQTINDIYMYAWEKGCKGITIYREGCRDGVLINKFDKTTEFKQYNAPRRPKSLDSDVKEVKIKGNTYSVLVGLMDNKPYEVFVLNYSLPSIKGKIVKEESGKYLYGTINVTEQLTDEQAAITRLVSTALRHGTDIKFIVEQLNKTQGDLTSFSRAIARVLKQYVKNGTELKGSNCPLCGSKLVVENGCEICKSCGTTKCN